MGVARVEGERAETECRLECRVVAGAAKDVAVAGGGCER